MTIEVLELHPKNKRKKVKIMVDGEPVYLSYLHDREISHHIWNRYMKKYGSKYRLIKDGINIWHIRCRFGSVQLYSLLKHQLCFVGDFRSKQHKTYFKKKLDFKHEISQEGDSDIVIMFDKKILDSTAKAFRPYYKIKISEERRRQLSEQMKHVREMRGK